MRDQMRDAMRPVTIYLDDSAVRRLLRMEDLLAGMPKVLMDLSAVVI